MVPTLIPEARLKRESGSKPELSPQLYAPHRGGPQCHCFPADYQLIKWEGGPFGGASQETCQGIHRFSIRGGRMEKENSGHLRAAILSLFFGLGLTLAGFERSLLTADFESNFLRRKFDSVALFIL
jgi:hypothetical protein